MRPAVRTEERDLETWDWLQQKQEMLERHCPEPNKVKIRPNCVVVGLVRCYCAPRVGFRIPAQFCRLKVRGIIGLPLRGRVSRCCWIAVYSRALLTLVSEPRSRGKLEMMRLVEGASLSKTLNLPGLRTMGLSRCINSNRGDWNKWGVIGYQIWRKRGRNLKQI